MTIRAARLGGKVTAIEADPDLVDRLRSNLAINSGLNITVIQAAATDTAGTIELHRAPRALMNRGQASLLALDHLTGDSISVPAITLDSLDLGEVRLLKIDVEGAEARVLRGAWATIQRCRPYVIFEMTPEYSTEYGFIDLFRELGYTLQSVAAARHRLTGRVGGPRLVPLGSTNEHNVLATPD